MDNPWIQLPEWSPYVLPADSPQIHTFNHRLADSDRRIIRLDIRPEPFIGRLDAPIVLLYLNPGYTTDDRQLHVHPDGEALWRANVLQDPIPYPFYMLDPRIAWAPGARWWQRSLNKLIALSDLETVARNVLCIEYFPYHSVGDPRFPGVVPSQKFGFSLVSQAIDRDAVIMVTRAGRAWREQVPNLTAYSNAFSAKSPRQAIIGPGNYPEGFRTIAQMLGG